MSVQEKPQAKVGMPKHFLTIGDYTPTQIDHLLADAIEMKNMHKKDQEHPYLKGKVLGMIFEKSSTRTRVSFEVGMLQLGGQAIFLSAQDIQLGRGETVQDTAQVLSRYVDGLMIRTFEHEGLQTFAQHASVPVINGLSDDHHPAQVMADLLTILEYKGKLRGLKMCYIGDGNNIAHSLIEGAVKTGMHMSVATPPGYEPNHELLHPVMQETRETGSDIQFTHDPLQAVQKADVIVTDVWTSMGQEKEQQKRAAAFSSFQVNAELCQYAQDDFLFLHCLPAHRGEEVSAEIMDGPHSVVFDEAENRLHAQKAILKALLSDQ